MSSVVAALIITASCSWASPGSNRFTGDPVAAVDHYQDIPENVRSTLKRRIEKKAYSEIVAITKDGVGDGSSYEGRIYDMHFGSNKLCKEIDRSAWKPKAVERGMVFCEGQYCILLPTVCGNLSRITAIPKSKLKQGGGGGGGSPGILEGPLAGGGTIEGPLAGGGGAANSAIQAQFSPIQFELELPPLVNNYAVIDSAPIIVDEEYFPIGIPIPISWQTPSSPGFYAPAPTIPAPVPAIPEPSTWLLFFLGLVILAIRRGLQPG